MAVNPQERWDDLLRVSATLKSGWVTASLLISKLQGYGKAKTSNKASKPLKALLPNGAMSAIQHSQELKAYYARKTAEGKNEMLVINNVCNKLIHRVFACGQRREKYKDFYSPSFA